MNCEPDRHLGRSTHPFEPPLFHRHLRPVIVDIRKWAHVDLFLLERLREGLEIADLESDVAQDATRHAYHGRSRRQENQTCAGDCGDARRYLVDLMGESLPLASPTK